MQIGIRNEISYSGYSVLTDPTEVDGCIINPLFHFTLLPLASLHPGVYQYHQPSFLRRALPAERLIVSSVLFLSRTVIM